MKRSKNRKEEIYVVAANLFRKRGYVASTMRDIAEKVGIEPSSLYSHIKSKEEILINICTNCANEFESGMEAVLNAPSTYSEKILDLVDLHIDIAFDKPSSVTVFNDEWRHLPESNLASFQKQRNLYESNFKSILESGMKSGEFIELSKTTAFQLVINSVKWIHYSAKRMSKTELEAKRNEIKLFISRGLFRKIN